jgi:hypothetical protein
MHDEIARHGERLLLTNLFLCESEQGRSTHGQQAAVEDVQPLLCGVAAGAIRKVRTVVASAASENLS